MQLGAGDGRLATLGGPGRSVKSCGVLAMHERAHDELEQLCDVQAAYLLLRYSLSVRFVYLLRTIGPIIAELRDLLPRHDARLRRTLQFLLVDPTATPERRAELVAALRGLDDLA